MNKNLAIVTALIVLVVAVGAFLLTRNASEPAMEASIQTATPVATTPSGVEGAMDESEGAMMEGDLREVTLTATNFEYDQTEIRVKAGDTVRVTLRVEEGMHDFVVDEFNVRTEVVEEGGEETIEFVATDTGEYEFYCSVGEHRQMGMVGKLIVE